MLFNSFELVVDDVVVDDLIFFDRLGGGGGEAADGFIFDRNEVICLLGRNEINIAGIDDGRVLDFQFGLAGGQNELPLTGVDRGGGLAGDAGRGIGRGGNQRPAGQGGLFVGQEIQRVDGGGQGHLLVLGQTAGGIQVLFGKLERFGVNFADGGQNLGAQEIAPGVLRIQLDAIIDLAQALVQTGEDRFFVGLVLVLISGQHVCFREIVLGQIQSFAKRQRWRLGGWGSGNFTGRQGGKDGAGGFRVGGADD